MKHKRRIGEEFLVRFTLARRDKDGILCVPASTRHRIGFLPACKSITIGILLFVIALTFIRELLVDHKPGRTIFLFLAEGFFMLLFGVRTLWLWHKLRNLSSTATLCERFGLEVEQLKRIAAENSIRPDANVGGQDYFRAADFGEITTLLRASAQPLAASHTLLRPAAGTEQETGEQLLRAQA